MAGQKTALVRVIFSNYMETSNLQKFNPAKQAFFYALSLAALLFTALPAGMIVFQIINQEVPDPVGDYRGSYNDEALKFAISALLIAGPIFFFLAAKINQGLRTLAISLDSSLRKWLTYLILFVAMVVMLGWLVATINNFLNGELSLKFVLKFLTVAFITAFIFSYYFVDLRRSDPLAGNSARRVFAAASISLAAAVLIASFFYVESPAEARARRHDQLIIEDLSAIDSALNSYYYEKKQLPPDLVALDKRSYLYLAKARREKIFTAYEYRALDEKSFELCADFLMASAEVNSARADYFDPRWEHAAGRQCFTAAINILGKTERGLID